MSNIASTSPHIVPAPLYPTLLPRKAGVLAQLVHFKSLNMGKNISPADTARSKLCPIKLPYRHAVLAQIDALKTTKL